MSDHDLVAVGNLGLGFVLDPVSGQINVDLSSIALNVTTETIRAPAECGTNNGTTQAWSRGGMTMTRTAAGQWSVTFASAHPDGTDYHPSITAEEQSNLRDTPDITIVQDSKTANGFSYQITTGDNGGTADSYVDTPHTLSVGFPLDVVTAVAIA